MNKIILEQAQSIIDKTLPPISNISNLLAILYLEFENINWAGLYMTNNTDRLCTLGCFQGKVACTRIPFDKGVVGTCASLKQTIVVDNVHEFKGHIACDCQSKSELVIPLIHNDVLYAILDIDSNVYSNFDNDKVETIQEIAYMLSKLVSSDKI